jgi:hypothetical protein
MADLKGYKIPGSDEILAKLIQADGKHYGLILKFINSIWNIKGMLMVLYGRENLSLISRGNAD